MKQRINVADKGINLHLTGKVAEKFRLNDRKREAIVNMITKAVSHWREVSVAMWILRSEMGDGECFYITDEMRLFRFRVLL